MPDSEENILEHCLDLVKSNNADMDTIQMKDALAAIAEEVQRFRCNSGDNLTNEIDDYKTRLKIKRKKIKTLKDNLNTACIIAKTVMTAKESESFTLNKRLNLVKTESASLIKKNMENKEIIQRLSTENNTLTERLKNLTNFIALGYAELKKMRGEHVNELSAELELKEIMVCCGQYYADYCNEHEKRIQLEQRNRYLTNKLQILETNIDEFNKCKNQKEMQKKGLANARDSFGLKLKRVDSEYRRRPQVNVSRVSVKTIGSIQNKENSSSDSLTRTESLDLSSHMSLVNNLLTDQDTMLKDLRKLAEELNVSPR